MKKLNDLIESIQEFYYSIKNGLNNVLFWLPIIWKDKDYDQSYIYEILKTKLNKQSRYFAKIYPSKENNRKSRILNLICKLIQFEQTDYYNTEFECYIESNEIKSYLNKYRRQHKLLLVSNPKLLNATDYVIGIEIQYLNQIRCRKLIFKLLEENISSFWL